MKRINFILFTTVFILSGLNAQGQTALNLNDSMQYQPAYMGTVLTGFKRNTVDNRKSLLQGSSITDSRCAGDCPDKITVYTPKGTVLCDFSSSEIKTELVSTGEVVFGVMGPTTIGECKWCWQNHLRYQNWSRTDIYQEYHICKYTPHIAWLGAKGCVPQRHPHGGRIEKVVTGTKEHNQAYWCCLEWLKWWALMPELNNAVETVASGEIHLVNYTGEKGKVVLGSAIRTNEDQKLPPQIANIKYIINGRELTKGEDVLMNNAGDHTFMGEINTKSGGVVKFIIPFTVIKPVTVEEITQKELNNGEIQFSIKILNNIKDRSTAGWVSTSMLNKPGYTVSIQGPEQYNLTMGSSAVINILLSPTEFRFIDTEKPEAPVSFDFIISNSPGENGLIIDRKTVSAQPSAITTAGGIAGTDGPQKLRTISVKTISGEVIDVKVPNNIRPGDNITGSVVPKTQSSTLQGAVIDVENNKTDLKDKLFKMLVPAGLTSIPLIIKDINGAELGRTNIPVNVPNFPTPGNNVTVPTNQIEMPPQPSPGSFAPINYCQPGQPLTINGFFDGNAANTTVSINNIPCEIIAESSTGSFANVPLNLTAGQASLTIQEGGVTETIPIQVVTTDLSTNKTVVQKNTKATITATVSGLENLDLNNNNFKIELTNGSPGIIKFNEANTTTISRDINSSNVKNGTFSFTTDITGTSTGSYTVASNVRSTTCTDCWKEYENCIAAVEAEEKQCYKDCDKKNGGISCYLACSAAARVKEAECFAQYLDCVRKKMGLK